MQLLQSQIHAKRKETSIFGRNTQKTQSRHNYSGVSGRGVGKLFGFGKSNVYNWIKKTEVIVENSPDIFELDELYWFIKRKPRTETRENIYWMTMVSRNPRQIAGFAVARDKTANHIQNMVDHAPYAEKYCTDGYVGYMDVVFPEWHIRNIHNKSDTFTVEGINADFAALHPGPCAAQPMFCAKFGDATGGN